MRDEITMTTTVLTNIEVWQGQRTIMECSTHPPLRIHDPLHSLVFRVAILHEIGSLGDLDAEGAEAKSTVSSSGRFEGSLCDTTINSRETIKPLVSMMFLEDLQVSDHVCQIRGFGAAEFLDELLNVITCQP